MRSANQSGFPARSRSAFTLVETLAAVAVGGLLLLLLAQILGGGFSVWTSVHAALDTEAEARAALGRMKRDLQGYVGDTRGGESFRLVRDSDGVGPDGSKAKRADWLMFISHPLEREMDDPSGVCAVSYRLVYEKVPGRESAASEHFSLRRRLVDSPTTFRDFLDTDDLSEGFAENAPSRETEEIIASHVIDFHITPIFRTPVERSRGAETTSPRHRVPDADRITVRNRSVAIEGSGSPPKDARFQAVEISLSVLRPSGIALIDQGAEIETIAPDHIANFSQIVTFPVSPGKID